MTMPMLLAAAKPWTFWLGPALLIAVIALAVVLAVGYYRKVMVPAYLWRLEEEKRRRSRGTTREALGRSPGAADPLAA